MYLLLLIIIFFLILINFYLYLNKEYFQEIKQEKTKYCDDSELYIYKNIFFENYLEPYPFKPGKYDPSYNLLTKIARKNMNN